MRLKQELLALEADFEERFQYQKGAIKTLSHEGGRAVELVFQYQKGAIKTGLAGVIDVVHEFFQYQKGAIKTHGGSTGCCG